MKKYTDDLFIDLVPRVNSLSDLIRQMGLETSGNYYSMFRKRIVSLELDTSHWCNPLRPEVIELSDSGTNKKLKRELIQLRDYTCERCLLSEWQDEPIVLELHHIDGNTENSKLENLQLLCPNCHSLTPNWRGRAVGQGKNTCLDCGVCISRTALRCKKCAARETSCLGNTPRQLKFLISKEEMAILLKEMSIGAIAKRYGVNWHSVKKRAVRLGLTELPTRGGRKKYGSLV